MPFELPPKQDQINNPIKSEDFTKYINLNDILNEFILNHIHGLLSFYMI